MSNLLETVIEAHGGLDRWRKLDAVSVHGVNGGVLWALKGQAISEPLLVSIDVSEVAFT